MPVFESFSLRSSTDRCSFALNLFSLLIAGIIMPVSGVERLPLDSYAFFSLYSCVMATETIWRPSCAVNSGTSCANVLLRILWTVCATPITVFACVLALLRSCQQHSCIFCPIGSMICVPWTTSSVALFIILLNSGLVFVAWS